MLILAKNFIVIVVKCATGGLCDDDVYLSVVKQDAPLERVHTRRKSCKVFPI